MLSTRSRGGYTATSPHTFVRVNNSRGTNQQTRAKASTSAATYTRCATSNSTGLSTAVSQGRCEKHGPVIRKNCPNKTHGCPWRGPEDKLQHRINYDCLYQKVECSICKETNLLCKTITWLKFLSIPKWFRNATVWSRTPKMILIKHGCHMPPYQAKITYNTNN